MDFIQKIVNFDETTGKFEVFLIPNPERYKLETRRGKKGYYDIFVTKLSNELSIKIPS